MPVLSVSGDPRVPLLTGVQTRVHRRPPGKCVMKYSLLHKKRGIICKLIKLITCKKATNSKTKDLPAYMKLDAAGNNFFPYP